VSISSRSIWTIGNAALSLALLAVVWLFFWPFLSTSNNVLVSAVIVIACYIGMGVVIPGGWFLIALALPEELTNKLLELVAAFILIPVGVVLVASWPSLVVAFLLDMQNANDCGKYGAFRYASKTCLDMVQNSPEFWKDMIFMSVIWWIIAGVIIALLYIWFRIRS